MRLALAVRVDHAHGTAVRAIGNAGDQAIVGCEHQAGIGLAEVHLRTSTGARREATSVDHDLAARNGCCGSYPIDPRNSVLLWRGPESKFHSRSISLKCSAMRKRMAAYTPAIQSS